MAKMALMLVDDELRYLETTAKLLARKGYQALTAPSGVEAMEKLKTEYVDVVILDVKMPGMDGLEVLKRIKADHPLVEVIMLTGHGTIDTAVDGMRNGAFDYLTKPCDIDELINKGEEAFIKKQAMEEKIRQAQVRKAMASPKDLVREVDGE
ncbi:chemotaxis protein CheY [Desulfocarbo indianensis]|nr:chemotaxis protein CheY [Desulfocarbo indianensis]